MRKLRKDVQEMRICGTKGRGNRIFVIALIELLKACWMFRFMSWMVNMRSLEVLTEFRFI